MFRNATGHDVHSETSGKPTRATFSFADSLLAQSPVMRDGRHRRTPESTYMIGDNPASDIAVRFLFFQSALAQTRLNLMKEGLGCQCVRVVLDPGSDGRVGRPVGAQVRAHL